MTDEWSQRTGPSVNSPESAVLPRDTGESQKAARRAPRRPHRHAPALEVPQTREARDQIRQGARETAGTLDRSSPLYPKELRRLAAALLERIGLSGDDYIGFAMVCIHSEFWREQLTAVDFHRRLLLLPHCLRDTGKCRADYDAYGLNCRTCGACPIGRLKAQAESLGYTVLVAEGTPLVFRLIMDNRVDAVIGVSCLSVLEKAIDRVLQVGVPAVAVPLLVSGCRDTSVDEDWVSEILPQRSVAPAVRTRTFVPLLRASHVLFEPARLRQLIPMARWTEAHRADAEPVHGSDSDRGTTDGDPVDHVQSVALGFLTHGGKRLRPAITLATYDALTGGHGTRPDIAEKGIDFPEHVQRVALAMEVFHKASLVHDDIEDDDDVRYGMTTLHRRWGVPVALNVGDYLIGLGYQLVTQAAPAAGADTVMDILRRLSLAHMKLAEGQGAELLWRQKTDKSFRPLDALKIYALKTAPAFDAALYAGVRLAGPAEPFDPITSSFSRNVGVAFQVLNDLKDWDGDTENRRAPGTDILAARPTFLLALALEAGSDKDREALLDALRAPDRDAAAVQEIRAVLDRCGVFEQAERLVSKYRTRAEADADKAASAELRALLHFLVSCVLQPHPQEDLGKPVELPSAPNAGQARPES